MKNWHNTNAGIQIIESRSIHVVYTISQVNINCYVYSNSFLQQTLKCQMCTLAPDSKAFVQIISPTNRC